MQTGRITRNVMNAFKSEFIFVMHRHKFKKEFMNLAISSAMFKIRNLFNLENLTQGEIKMLARTIDKVIYSDEKDNQASERNAKMESNMEKAVELYASEFIKALDDGFTIAESHEIAKAAMIDKYQEVKSWRPGGIEWGRIGSTKWSIVSKYKNTNSIDVMEPVKIQSTGKSNFMQIYRDFCEAGFLPRNLEPLIGLKKQQQITSYKCQLADKGYVFEETPYGWVVVEKPEKINPKKIEMGKKIEELKMMLQSLENEFSGLE